MLVIRSDYHTTDLGICEVWNEDVFTEWCVSINELCSCLVGIMDPLHEVRFVVHELGPLIIGIVPLTLCEAIEEEDIPNKTGVEGAHCGSGPTARRFGVTRSA